MRNNKKNRKRLDSVSEIFKFLWGFNLSHENFIKEIHLLQIKKEIWPKIKLIVDREDKEKKDAIKAVILKYGFPSDHLEFVISGDKKGSETKTTESDPSPMAGMNKPAGKENGKPNIAKILGGRKLPPFKCI